MSSSRSLSFRNSIVSGNSAEMAAEILARNFSANNANLLGDNSRINDEAFVGFNPGATDINATGDKRNIALSVILNQLADNGGPTQTHSVPKNSPVIGAAKTSNCPDQDQRGEPRDTSAFFIPIVASSKKIAVVDLGGDCDIGAVEYQPGD